MKKIFLCVVSAFFVCLSACKVEDYNLSDINTDDLELSTSVGSPIGRSSISIADLLKKQDVAGLGYDENGVVVFTYDSVQHFEIEPIKANGFNSFHYFAGLNLFEDEIEKTGIPKDEYIFLGKPIPLTLSPNEKIRIKGYIAVSDLLKDQEVRIDSIIFKEAPLHVALTSNIEGLLENSTISLINEENGFKQNAKNKVILDLSNTVLRLANSDSVEVECILTIKKKINIKLSATSYITMHMAAGDGTWKFEKAWGVFNGLEPQIGNEVIPIDIFEKNEQDGMKYNLLVEDPRITLKVQSNVGIPFRLGVDKLEATNNKKTVSAKFENGKNTYSKDLKYAKKPGDNITALDVTFNKKNGGIDQLVNLLPNQVTLAYNFQAINGDLKGDKNYFITDDAYIDMLCKVELPAYLRKGSYILVSDTLKDLDFAKDLGEKYSFEKIKLTAVASNSLPFDAKVRFYFLQQEEGSDEISIIPDSNINKTVSIAAGKVNSSNDIVGKSTATIDLIQFNEKDIPSLKKAKHLLIMYEVAVNEFNKVKVTRDNKLSVFLKAFAKGSVNIGKLNETNDESN